MMMKGPNQQSVEIFPLPFHNDHRINDQLDNTGKILCALQPTSQLNSVVYLILEANSSIPF